MQTTPRLKRPQGLKRWFFRAPIWLYKIGLGGVMGKRFLLLNHVGRKSGLPRKVVLEVTQYDRDSETYYIASGWGKQSDWFQNLRKQPEVTIQVGGKERPVTAVFLNPEASGEIMVDYARRYPKAALALSRFMGFQADGREETYRQIGQNIPFVALKPRNS